MARKSKTVANRKSNAKLGKGKTAVKKTAGKAYGVKAAKKTVGALAKTAGERTKANTRPGKTVVRRAMNAIAAFASPIIPSRASK
jgi:hypothetical protein